MKCVSLVLKNALQLPVAQTMLYRTSCLSLPSHHPHLSSSPQKHQVPIGWKILSNTGRSQKQGQSIQVGFHFKPGDLELRVWDPLTIWYLVLIPPLHHHGSLHEWLLYPILPLLVGLWTSQLAVHAVPKWDPS